MLSRTIEINVEFDGNGKPTTILVGFDGEYDEFEIHEEDNDGIGTAKARALDDAASWIEWIVDTEYQDERK